MSTLRLKPTLDAVRVRQAPVNGAVVTQVNTVDILDVIESADAARAKVGKPGEWIQVKTQQGAAGFVAAQFLKLAPDPEKTIEVPVLKLDNAAPEPQIDVQQAVATLTAAAAADPDTRLRKAAFAITSAFEGHGYAAYQNYDSGVISYGRFQFTLAAGSLVNIVNKFLERSNSACASELRGSYAGRLNAKDATLKDDARLKQLLLDAANEKEMQEVQDEAAIAGYWKPMLELSAAPRGIKSVLGLALFFDMAINHGLRHPHIGNAETALGIQPRSMVGQNGVLEEKLIAEVARQRNDFMHRFADKHNFPGLKVRGNFWVDLVSKNDWNLQGDASGSVNVNGKIVQVRTP